jgi:hypothetical protein
LRGFLISLVFFWRCGIIETPKNKNHPKNKEARKEPYSQDIPHPSLLGCFVLFVGV